MPRAKKTTKTVKKAKAKKTKKKAVSKKSSTVKKAKSKKTMKQAPEECCFWVNNGPVIGNLADLYDTLNAISDEQFSYHTVRNGNDFAIWIEEVICEPVLADKVSKSINKQSMRRVIGAHLK